MSENKEEGSVAGQTNTSVAGAGFFIPFLEKLKLYQRHLRKDSIWEKNKSEYWRHEKAILQWAWSRHHQHLARNLTIQRLREAYGLSVTTNPNNPSDTNYHLCDRPVELLSKNAKALVKEMFDDRCGKLEPIMGNLYLKGFADVITYGDLAEKLGQSGDTNAAKKLLGLSYVVHSVVINTNGLLMGELVDEQEKGKLWWYKLTVLGIYNVLLLSAVSAVSLALKQLTDISTAIYVKPVLLSAPLQVPNWVVFLAVVFSFNYYKYSKL